MPEIRLTLSLAVLNLVLLNLIACSPQAQTPVEPRTVMVHKVTASASASPMVFNGEVRARHEVDLAFRVGGKIIVRSVDAGARVKPGMSLARLDPADLQLATQAAQAQLAAAESDAATTMAERDRFAGLLAKKFVSQAAFDARQNIAKGASARLAQARAQTTASGNQLAYSTLQSDRDGVITQVFANAGQVVAAGQPVLRLAQQEELEVAIAIPESRVAAFKAAKTLRVSLWSAPELQLSGTLRELSPAADAATRTYAARVKIIAPPPTVQLGMTASVHVESEETNAAILVPSSAIVDQGHGPAVWVLIDHKLHRQPVVVAQFRENGVLLASGLKGGETIVAAGAHLLSEGLAVKPLPMAELSR